MNDKLPVVVELVAWLQAKFGPTLIVVDHWNADLTAIGVALKTDPQRLAYIAALPPSDRYFIELETAPTQGSYFPYTVVGRFDAVDRDRLLRIVDDHLRQPDRGMQNP